MVVLLLVFVFIIAHPIIKAKHNCMINLDEDSIEIYNNKDCKQNLTSVLSISSLTSLDSNAKVCTVYLDSSLEGSDIRLVKTMVARSHHGHLQVAQSNKLLTESLLKVYNKALLSDCVFIVSDQSNKNKDLSQIFLKELSAQHPQLRCIKHFQEGINDLAENSKTLQDFALRKRVRGIVVLFMFDYAANELLQNLKTDLERSPVNLIWILPYSKYDRIAIFRGTISFRQYETELLQPIPQNDTMTEDICGVNLRDGNPKRHMHQSFVEMKLFVNDKWQPFYWAHSNGSTNQIIDNSELLFTPDTIGIPTIKKRLKIVSIFSAQYLLRRDDLLKDRSCIASNSMICLIPPNKTSPIYGKNLQHLWEETCCAGYVVDLIKLLEVKLFFKGYLYIVEDGKYGGFDKSGKGSGMPGDIYYGKAHMAIAPLTINTNREKYIEFSVPYVVDSFGIMKRKTDVFETGRIFQFGFYIPFSWETLCSMFGLVVFSVFIFYISEYIIALSRKSAFDQSPKIYPFSESLLYVVGVFFQRDIGGKRPHSLSSLLLVYCLVFALSICSTMYTAALTANLVITNEDFAGFYDPKIQNPTEDFKFGVNKDTSTEHYFRYSDNPSLQKIYHFFKKYSVKSTEVAIQKILNRELDGFIDEYSYTKSLIQEYGDVIELYKVPHVQILYGIALAKNSSLTELVSQALLKLVYDKEIDFSISNRWKSFMSKPSKHTQSFSLKEFGALFLLLGIAILFLVFCESIAVLILRLRNKSSVSVT